MTKKQAIQLFEQRKVRTVWDDEQEKWYFSIVDVCCVLTDQPDYEHARNYWKVLKHRLVKEGNETVTNCNQLKLRATDGKMRLTDVEIALNTLAEASATELSKQRNPKGYKAQTRIAKDGGSVATAARKQLEGKLGRSVISSEKASDYLLPENTEDET